MNDGDWVEGEVQWWWKFVFPQKAQFWVTLLQTIRDPSPDPWVQATTGEVLEAVVMLHAAAKAVDKEQRATLHKEAAQTLEGAVAAIRRG
jgi:hypothetical protein